MSAQTRAQHQGQPQRSGWVFRGITRFAQMIGKQRDHVRRILQGYHHNPAVVAAWRTYQASVRGTEGSAVFNGAPPEPVSEGATTLQEAELSTGSPEVLARIREVARDIDQDLRSYQDDLQLAAARAALGVPGSEDQDSVRGLLRSARADMDDQSVQILLKGGRTILRCRVTIAIEALRWVAPDLANGLRDDLKRGRIPIEQLAERAKASLHAILATPNN